MIPPRMAKLTYTKLCPFKIIFNKRQAPALSLKYQAFAKCKDNASVQLIIHQKVYFTNLFSNLS